MGSSVRAPVEVQFKATGVDAVRSGIRLVRGEANSASSAASQLGDSYSQGSSRIVSGAQRAAGALSMVAASGEAGQRQMRSFIVAGADMALTFGLGGPVVAALGLLGLAIYNTFARARKEIEDTNKKIIEGVQSARRANSLEATAKEVGTLYQGDRTAIKGEPGHEKETDAQFLGRSRGLEGLTQRKEQLETELKINQAVADRIAKEHEGDAAAFNERLRSDSASDAEYNQLRYAKGRLAVLQQQLPLIREQYDLYHKQYSTAKGATGGLNDQVARAVDVTTNAIRREHDEKAPAELDRRVALLLEKAKSGGFTSAATGRGKNGALVALTSDLDEARTLVQALNAELAKPQEDVRIDQIKKEIHELNALPGLAPKNTIVGDVLGPISMENYLNHMFPTTAQIDYGGKPQVAQITAAALGPIAQAREAIVAQFAQDVQEPLEHAIRSGMASTIGSAVGDGITAGFQSHSISDGFKAAGKAILAGIGGIFEQMGQVWIEYGIAMTTLGSALWNPFTSGPAAIAIGVLLTGLGATLGAVAHGGSSSSGGSSARSYAAISSTTFIDPTSVSGSSPVTKASGLRPQQAGNQTVFVIGTDPKAWSQVQQQLNINSRRG